MSDELKAICAGIVLILGAIGTAYAALKKANTKANQAETNQDIKKSSAQLKTSHAETDHVIEKWRDLYEENKRELKEEIAELRQRIETVQTEHLECSKKLAAANVRIEDLCERIKVLEKQ